MFKNIKITFDKKIYSLLMYAVTALILLAALVSFLLAPGMAHRKIVAGLKSAGFETKYIQKPQVAFGAMLYRNVKFDEYDFSTIKYIRATYNPFIFMATGRFHDLDIVGLNLTGDWADETPGSLSFSGWAPPDLSAVPFLAFRHINISNSRVSLLTQTAGGMSVFFGVAANRKDKKTEFQSSVKTEQKFLSLISSANGVIDGPRWYADIEIIDGKFEDPSGHFRASRMNGWFNMASPVTEPFKIMGQLRAGGFSLYDLPWQNAAATVDFSDGDLKLFGEAKSVGYEGLELEINLFKKATAPAATGGTVHADQAKSFFDYFKERKEFAGFLKDLKKQKQTENIDVDFLAQPKNIRYEIKKPPPGIGKTGEIPFTF